MSQVLVPGYTVRMPDYAIGVSGGQAAITLDATGETCLYAGYIILQDPEGGNKTISSAGGGKIVWMTGAAVTFANVASVFKVGLQDVSTASSPTQGDGTFDVSATYTGSGLASATLIESAMTTGTKTISNGQLLAIVLEFTTRAGADSVVVQPNTRGNYAFDQLLPAVVSNTSGSFAKTTGTPNAVIVFDDGTLGWFYGCTLQSKLGSSIAINVNSATTDEIGLYVIPSGVFKATGLDFVISIANSSADFEINIFQDPLSAAPILLKSIIVDATQYAAYAAAYPASIVFDTPITMNRGIDYGVSIRPTTTNNITLFYSEKNTASYTNMGPPNDDCFAIGRLDNSGPFADWNGGTAKTRVPLIWATGTYMTNETHNASYQIGI